MTAFHSTGTRVANVMDVNQPAGVLTFFMSDWSYGAVIEGEATAYQNEYNPKEARKRLKRFFTKGLELALDTVNGRQFDSCVVALGGNMVDTSTCADLEDARKLRSEAVQLLYDQIIGLRHAGLQVYVPCIAVSTASRSVNDKTVHEFHLHNADVAFYKELEARLEDVEGIYVDFLVQQERVQWDLYDTPFILTSAGAFTQDMSSLQTAFDAALKHREALAESLAPYRAKYQVDRLNLLVSQSPFSFAALEQGIIGNSSMKGIETEDTLEYYDTSPRWHVMTTFAGMGTTAVFQVYGSNPIPEDAQDILSLPAISYNKRDKAKTGHESNISVIQFA